MGKPFVPPVERGSSTGIGRLILALSSPPTAIEIFHLSEDLTRHVSKVSRELFPALQPSDRESVVSAAIYTLLTRILERRLWPDSDPGRWQGMLRVAVRNALFNAHAAYESENGTERCAALPEEVAAPTPQPIAEVIAHSRDLDRQVADYVVARNRFPLLTEKMIRYFVKCLLIDEGPQIRTMALHLQISSDDLVAMFGWTDVMCRAALYDLYERWAA